MESIQSVLIISKIIAKISIFTNLYKNLKSLVADYHTGFASAFVLKKKMHPNLR